jgi:hypothetical protein
MGLKLDDEGMFVKQLNYKIVNKISELPCLFRLG